MWSSKSVIFVSVVSVSITVVITLIIRQKIQSYIEHSAKKMISTSSNNQNEYLSSAFQSIGGSKDIQSVIPQTSNKIVKKQVVEEKVEYVKPSGAGEKWTPL